MNTVLSNVAGIMVILLVIGLFVLIFLPVFCHPKSRVGSWVQRNTPWIILGNCALIILCGFTHNILR